MIELMHRFSKVSVLPKCTHMGGAEFLEVVGFLFLGATRNDEDCRRSEQDYFSFVCHFFLSVFENHLTEFIRHTGIDTVVDDG